jgi:hypothetical protein
MAGADIVAAFAKLGRFTDEKIAVVAPVRLVAGTAILRYRRMLEGVRPFLFRVAPVAEVRDGIGIKHVFAEAAVGGMAIGAFDLPFGDGMAGLPRQLTSHLLVAGDAHGRLGVFQIEAAVGVDRVAVFAGDIVFLVNAGIPLGDGG